MERKELAILVITINTSSTEKLVFLEIVCLARYLQNRNISFANHFCLPYQMTNDFEKKLTFLSTYKHIFTRGTREDVACRADVAVYAAFYITIILDEHPSFKYKFVNTRRKIRKLPQKSTDQGLGPNVEPTAPLHEELLPCCPQPLCLLSLSV